MALHKISDLRQRRIQVDGNYDRDSWNGKDGTVYASSFPTDLHTSLHTKTQDDAIHALHIVAGVFAGGQSRWIICRANG